jgi:hypothetical protein
MASCAWRRARRPTARSGGRCASSKYRGQKYRGGYHDFTITTGGITVIIDSLNGTGPHESTVREYAVNHGGLVLGDPLAEFQGVLGGVPSYTGEALPSLERGYS